MRLPALCTLAVLAAVPATPQGTLVVLNKAEATASLVDLASGSVVASVPTGLGPHEVAVSPDGQRALASNYGSREAQGSSLTLIDIPAGRVAATIDLGRFRRPHGVQWLDDTRAVVTSEASRTLLLVDVEKRRVSDEIRTDQETSHMVAVTPGGARAFVANIGSGSVTAIDLQAGERLAQIPTGDGAEGIDVTPDGREVWVTNRGGDSLSVIDAESLAVVASIACGEFPIRVRITPEGRHALVSNARSADLAGFDVAGRSEVARIRFGETAGSSEGRLFGDRFGASSVPIGVVVSPDGTRAWVAHANADRISVVDLGSWQATGHLTAGREPDGMAYSPVAVER
jgi:YVTN family beta-propeller protein